MCLLQALMIVHVYELGEELAAFDRILCPIDMCKV